MMTQTNAKKDVTMIGSANLKQQIRTETNVRFLRNLPAFKADRALPDVMEDLLDRLDQAERSRRLS